MPRALFEKTGNAVYISHLDLMRLFQRAFKRADLPLTHTKGFNPRPSVSIALPLSLGVSSHCELLDFDLEDPHISCDEMKTRLSKNLISGIRVLDVYENGGKLKNLAFLECSVSMEYDKGIPEDAEAKLNALFSQEEIIVEKKSKNGVGEQNIAPMIRRITVDKTHSQELTLRALICCQNPTLNPTQLHAAVCKYLPELTPDFTRCCRQEIYDHNEIVFR